MNAHITRWIRLVTLTVLLASLVPAWPMPQTDQSSSSSDTKTKRSKTKKASADQNTSENSTAKLDLNTATKEELDALPGVGETYAQKIIDGRPYKSKSDLIRKDILPQSTYDKIKDQITARRTSKAENSGEKMSTTPRASSEPEEKSKSTKKEKSNTTGNERYSKNENEQEETGSTAQTPPEKGMVWVNLDSGIYHREGDRWYGKTMKGKFMSEADAQKAGYRVSKVGQSEK